MVSSVKKTAYIPPYWVNLAIAGFILLVTMYRPEQSDVTLFDMRMQRYNLLLRILGICLLIPSCIHFSIHPKGLLVHFLWLPVWFLKWNHISSAEYVYSWKPSELGAPLDGQGIFITLKGCSFFSPEVDGVITFWIKNFFRCFFIRFTPRKQKLYVAVFQQYYPQLQFQIGYEKNLKKGKDII